MHEFDALDVEKLRRRRDAKWSIYPAPVLPAWVAEMDYPLAEPIRRELERAAADSEVGYPTALPWTGLVECFAERMADRFGWQPEPQRVEVLSEVVQGIFGALYAYSKPGEGIVVQTPIYPPFLQSVAATGRRLVDNRLTPRSSGHGIDFDALRAAADAGTRVLLLCNPHNPTGRVFSAGELGELAEIAVERDWIVVADEIHGDLVYPGRRHVPFATLSPEIAERTVTLTSATKAFNIPGLRCAIAHFGSEDLQQRFDAAAPPHVRGGVGLLGIYATIAAWRDSQPWLDSVLAYLDGNRRFLTEFVDAQLPGVKTWLPEATYLAWLDCSALRAPRSASHFFLKRAEVALQDGDHFGQGFADHARLNFATSRPILQKILERMATAVQAEVSGDPD